MANQDGLLKKKRIEKNLTLDDVEKILKIRKRHLRALEEGEYTDTPGITYAIGYLKAYSALLDLTDEERQEIIDEINRAFSSEKKAQPVFTKEVIPLEDEGESKSSKKPEKTPSVNFKKVVILTSIVAIIGILGFFGFKILTQNEDFSFKKSGIYTPYIKATINTEKKGSNAKNNTPIPGSPTPQGTEIPTVTPTITPLPKVMAKFNIKIVPKDTGWIKVYNKEAILFEGIMAKGKEYLFKSTSPITLIVEDGKLFDIYSKNKTLSLPKGNFVKYTLKEENTKQNG